MSATLNASERGSPLTTFEIGPEFEAALRAHFEKRDNAVAFSALSALIAQATLSVLPESARKALDTPQGRAAFKAATPRIIRAYFRAIRAAAKLRGGDKQSREGTQDRD
jgi:tellurite resistance protein